ncbi:MAG TPA: L,D-transpeptidase, partial [Thermoanaerobaculia bacterium]|nr:L,D-transpeptidase [Thermoanaerobaculia bacterium]
MLRTGSKLLTLMFLGSLALPAVAAARPPLEPQKQPAPAPATAPAPAQAVPAQPAQAAPAQAAPARPVPAQPARPAPVPAQPQPAPIPAQPAQPAAAMPAQVPAGDIQVLLDRLGFSPGVVDGKGGRNTSKALAAFQAAHDLPVTGKLDAVTWQNLTAGGGTQAVAEYTITADDLKGPFTPKIPEDMEEKAKLPALGYTSPLEMFSERFHSTPEFLQQLNPQATFSTAGERLRVPNVRTVPTQPQKAPQGVRVVVNKADWSLTVENGDDLLFYAPVTAGSEHDPLPLGQWKVQGVARNPSFNYNPDLFWDADPEHSKAKIPAGPNNPVGVVWIDLSKEHYGIHGTPEPRTIGRTTSHG